jgi:DHA2 family multidrug resistance protein
MRIKEQALGALAGSVRCESFLMAYDDSFLLLGALLAATVVLVWLCQPAKGLVAGGH